ncbi:MAG: hypothetical protein ACE5H3_03450 [Planctomycetota bacterium]
MAGRGGDFGPRRGFSASKAEIAAVKQPAGMLGRPQRVFTNDAGQAKEGFCCLQGGLPMNRPSQILLHKKEWGFLLIVLLGSIHFPFHHSPHRTAFQGLTLALTGLFVGLLFLFLRRERRPAPDDSISSLGPRGAPPPSRTLAGTILLAAAWEILSLFALFFQQNLYEKYGYDLDPAVSLSIFAFIFSILFLSWRFKFKADLLFGILLSVFVVHQVLSIAYFPLSPFRSDMLPLIQKATGSLLQGENPYREYALASGHLYLTYLPGMLLCYFPATALGFDLRVMNLIFFCGAMVFLYCAPSPGKRPKQLFFIVAIMLNPFLQMRHEVYIFPILFILSGMYFFLVRQRFFSLLVWSGAAATVSQLIWVVYPFLAVFLAKRRSMRTVVKLLASVMAGTGMIVLPFLLADPENFVAGSYGAWEKALSLPTLNFSFWILKAVPLSLLKFVQLAVLAALWIRSIFVLKSLKDLFQWASIAYFAFILTNRVVWPYFFMIGILLLLFFHLAEDSKSLESED